MFAEWQEDNNQRTIQKYTQKLKNTVFKVMIDIRSIEYADLSVR